MIENRQLLDTTYGTERYNWGYSYWHSEQLYNDNLVGSEVKVAVFDTGIDLNHGDLIVRGGTYFRWGFLR